MLSSKIQCSLVTSQVSLLTIVEKALKKRVGNSPQVLLLTANATGGTKVALTIWTMRTIDSEKDHYGVVAQHREFCYAMVTLFQRQMNEAVIEC